VKLPVMVMIRPRPGACCYSEHDFDVMLRDANDKFKATATACRD